MQPAHHQRTGGSQRIPHRLRKAGEPGGVDGIAGAEAEQRHSHAEGAAVGHPQDDGRRHLHARYRGDHQGHNTGKGQQRAQQQPAPLVPAFAGPDGHQQRRDQADHLVQRSDHPGRTARHAAGLQNGGHPVDHNIKDHGIDAEVQRHAPGQPAFPDGLSLPLPTVCRRGLRAIQPHRAVFLPDQHRYDHCRAPHHQSALPAPLQGGQRHIQRQRQRGGRHHGNGKIGGDLPHAGGIFRLDDRRKQHVAQRGADTDYGGAEIQSGYPRRASQHRAHQDQSQTDEDRAAFAPAPSCPARQRGYHRKGDQRQRGQQTGSAAGKPQACLDLRQQPPHPGNNDPQAEGRQNNTEHYLAFIFRFDIHPSFCFFILVMMLPVDQIDQAAQQNDRTDQMQPQHQNDNRGQ